MIIVKIELHSAVTGKVTELGKLHIINDGTGDASKGNYDVHKYGKNGRQLLAHARVERHARRSRTIFNLLRRALEALRA